MNEFCLLLSELCSVFDYNNSHVLDSIYVKLIHPKRWNGHKMTTKIYQ